MNLKELSSPIRMYWDIGPVAPSLLPDCRETAGEIIANKILSLQVTELSPALSHSCLTVLQSLKDAPISLSLVAPITALDAHALKLLSILPLKTLFAAVSQTGLASVMEITKRTEGRPSIGVAFPVTRANFRELPGVLSFCIDHGITNLLLPMQRLVGNGDCFSFSSHERKELTEALTKINIPAWFKVIIHDPFIWRAFYPSVEFPNSGCQAANTMLYISPEAEVYPCPTLPVKIGSLLGTSLKDIINSAAKKEVRKRILSTPCVCAECGELSQCRGGCRGRAYAVQGSFQGPDPACRESV